MIVYVLNEDTSIAFIYALSTIPWITDLSVTLSSSTSNLPSALSTTTSSTATSTLDNSLRLGLYSNTESISKTDSETRVHETSESNLINASIYFPDSNDNGLYRGKYMSFLRRKRSAIVCVPY